jgi:hypothetical protein
VDNFQAKLGNINNRIAWNGMCLAKPHAPVVHAYPEISVHGLSTLNIC